MTVNLDMQGPVPTRPRVWDLPVRITHVLLITCVAGAWLTREARLADLHAVFGYCALGLVTFRVTWGFVASGHARFASFAYGPHAVLQYLRDALRGAPRHFTGHNPAGGWSVFGLLALVGAASISGVLTLGGIHGDGPVPGMLGFAAADAMRELHEWLAWAVLILALLHVCGVAWGSRVHRENLVGAMITGRKTAHGDESGDAPRHIATGLAIAVAAAAFALLYLTVLAPRDAAARKGDEERFKASLKAQPWSVECSGCHLAYPPGILPAASWDRMLDEQHEHFGEDLGLSPAKIAVLRDYARRMPPASWGAWKLQRSATAAGSPQRLSEVAFWRHAHHGLPDSAFRPPSSAGRHECEACHADAHSGIFHPRMIHMSKAGVGS
jgi:cytochrome b